MCKISTFGDDSILSEFCPRFFNEHSDNCLQARTGCARRDNFVYFGQSHISSLRDGQRKETQVSKYGL